MWHDRAMSCSHTSTTRLCGKQSGTLTTRTLTPYRARFRWFADPAHVKRFINHRDVPRLKLPKRDPRPRDGGKKYTCANRKTTTAIDFDELDPERQRMVVRKLVVELHEGSKMVQYESFRRMDDMHYQLAGLQRWATPYLDHIQATRRTVEKWRERDPRTMTRTDPREEVG